MTVAELNEKYGHEGRQCGSKLLYITSDGTDETVHGYVIAMWDSNYMPTTVYSDIHRTTPFTPEMKVWDDAADAIWGKPSAPEFGRNLIK